MTGAVLLVALLLVAVGAPAMARARAQRRWDAAATASLEVGPLGVRRELVDGRIEEVHWDEVVEVDVVLADRGPHGAAGGVVVLYADASRGAMVPIDRLGSCALVEHLGRLPGFDSAALVSALGGAVPSHTTCWSTRPSSPPG